MIHCVSDVYVLTGFTIWPRWSQVHFEILCSVLHLDFWLVLGNIWEDVILVTYLYITALLIKPNEWVLECFFMFACGWKGKSGHLRLWLFSETELRQGHHITMGICTWGRSWGWMSLEVEGSTSWWFYWQSKPRCPSSAFSLLWDWVTGWREAVRALKEREKLTLRIEGLM